ncbi:alpha/beta hydrolase-fold protein [Sandarakinorhabdus sp. AAP62]|uniref:alpha/beta hydrolase n=1 Tax=Sandarakinorhabdus sp. AAP62 TaxID=1248916 RepID=UPI00030115FD|nr:alpha/beta hydrolase-fold protein [Sandarakinorhabdus sp. AAP62]
MINRRALIAGSTTLLAAPTLARESIQFTRHANVAGPGLQPRHVDVWVPPDAEANVRGARPLPLLLMHDGQNLFAPASAYGGVTWGVAETIMAGMAAGTLPPMIVAGVWNTGAQRWGDYVPADLMARLPGPLAARFNLAGGGPSRSDAYVALLADTVLPLLRAQHGVAPGKAVIAGSSMGGLASLNALMQRPDLFRAAGCLSTHWPVLAPQPEPQAGEVPAIQTAIADWIGARLGPPAGRRLWFDHGDQGLDQHYATFQTVADSAVVNAGWRRDTDFVSRYFPGTGHNEASWAARLALTFTFLFE